MDNKDRVKLGDIIDGYQVEDTPWDVVVVTRNCWLKLLKCDLEKFGISLQSKEKLDSIKVLHFVDITFETESVYSNLEIIKNVNCQVNSSMIANCSSVLFKALKILTGEITELLSGNISNIYIDAVIFNGLDIFELKKPIGINNLTTLELKKIDSFVWETCSELKLTHLVLSNISINKSKAEDISRIKTLKGLYFNNIEVVYMCNDKTFENLEVLNLKYVSSFVWKESVKLLNLKHLVLDEVPINELIIDNILEIGNLEKLELSAVYHGSDIGDILIRLGKLINLAKLKLSKMLISEQPNWIGELPELRYLELSSLKIEKFTVSRDLTELVLRDNPISNIEVSENIKIKRLNISNTNITELPRKITATEEFNCSGCRNMDWENFQKTKKILYSKMFKDLAKLDISYNNIKEIPRWLKRIKLGSLEWLNISVTDFTKLPFDDEKVPKLRCLIAENLRLEDFPEEISRHKNWRLHSGAYDFDIIKERSTRTKEEHIRRAYLRGTMAKEISPHFFTGGSKNTREEFWSHNRYEEGCQATIVFLGGKAKKDSVICSLFDVSSDDLIECGGGLRLVNTRAQLQVADEHNIPVGGSSSSKARRLDSDTELVIWALSQKPEYRSGHGMFMPNNALYVIVVDAKNTLDLQRKADFWFRFVKYNVDSADILFLLLKEFESDLEAIDLENYKMDSHCHVHRELAYMPADKNDELALDKARGVLTHAIRRLPSYSGKVLAGWKHVLRYIKGKLEVHPSLSYKCSKEANDESQKHLNFEDICNACNVGSVSGGMLDVLRALLVEAGICYDDGKDTLYSLAWISCLVYATMKHAVEKRGEVTIQELKIYLQDNVMQYDYFDLEIRSILNTLSDPPSRTKMQLTRIRSQMCIKPRNKYDAYLFPQFTYICERQWGPLEDKSRAEIEMQKKWNEEWKENLLNFRASKFVSRYIIDMPLLSDGLLVDIICRLVEILRESGNDDNCKHAVGADGLIALWHENYCLLVNGVPSAPGRLQIFVGLHKKKKMNSFHNSSDDVLKLPTKLTVIRDYAFKALFDAVKENVPLMVNMRAYLVLPNHYLAASSGSLKWRLALRDIYYSKRSGQTTFDYLEGSLPMDILEEFIPKPYEEALEKVLSWQIPNVFSTPNV